MEYKDALSALVISCAYSNTWVGDTDAFHRALAVLGWTWDYREQALFDQFKKKVRDTNE